MPRRAFGIAFVAFLLCSGTLVAGDDPYVVLDAPRELKPVYRATPSAPRDAEESVATLVLGTARPLSLAADDFDADGFPDLVVGYAGAGGGVLALHRGDPEAFGPTDPEVLRGIGSNRFPEPFLNAVQALALAVAPDFLVTGDFDRDGNRDVVVASRGGTSFYLLPGDGRGGFQNIRPFEASGPVTALTAAQDVDGRSLLALGALAPSGPEVVVYAGVDGIRSERPARSRLPAEATNLALGILDDEPPLDVAILAGDRLWVLHRKVDEGDPSGDLEAVDTPFGVKAFALGNFIWDRDARTEIAALGEDGVVRILSRGELDTRPFSEREIRERRRRPAAVRAAVEKRRAVEAPELGERIPWRVAEDLEAPASGLGARLLATRISSLPSDDLVVVEGGTSTLRLIHEAPAPGSRFARASMSGRSPRREVALRILDEPVAVLPMRVSVDGRPGLVILGSHRTAPYVVVPLAAVTYHVTGTGDSTAACSAPSGGVSNCATLRSAILASNANAGADTIVFDFNGTITLSVTSGGAAENAAASGDLDVNDSLTITGNGSANTIISTSYTSACGDCKVFGMDQTGGFPGITVAFGGLTIQNGYNNGAAFCGSFFETGGGLDFYLFGTGNTYSMTNCVVTNNQALGCALSHGGGV
ncbi:MAG TPA: VCBS repeat-containing protein, partial [Thermoanaerobaculia bacterium]|nr:VCBS repeat-containing protein [Thermoanaerobaculia bacterium]